ncbi:MAG: hypothetical protein HYY93_09885 [Planctomycetes bacterium]|nr:hypothetical protein [Planctomycetota bacterium]
MRGIAVASLAILPSLLAVTGCSLDRGGVRNEPVIHKNIPIQDFAYGTLESIEDYERRDRGDPNIVLYEVSITVLPMLKEAESKVSWTDVAPRLLLKERRWREDSVRVVSYSPPDCPDYSRLLEQLKKRLAGVEFSINGRPFLLTKHLVLQGTSAYAFFAVKDGEVHFELRQLDKSRLIVLPRLERRAAIVRENLTIFDLAGRIQINPDSLETASFVPFRDNLPCSFFCLQRPRDSRLH